MSTVQPGAAMPLDQCASLINMTWGEWGPRTRTGSREWVTGLDGPTRSALPFTASTPAANRRFFTTATGIWDCSDSSATPTQVVAFGDATGDAGYGVSHAVVNAAGAHFLLYCDEVNGYHVYTESTGLWAKVAQGAGADQIDGVDPGTFVFVAQWANRLYFVARGSANAWYLSINAIFGTATRFGFGSKFRAGGSLVGLWNWTQDGGKGGMNDRLVAVSRGGDVVIYEGYDPADASKFSIVGVWSVGAIPAGRQIATEFGGDLLILSTLGVVPASRLLVSEGVNAGQYATADITPLFTRWANYYRDLRGWALVIHPQDNALLILLPIGPGVTPTQLAMNFTTKAWSIYRDLAMTCACPSEGRLYFGTPDGRALVCEGDIDGVTLADPNSYTAIQFGFLSAFSSHGSGAQKIVQMVKPLFRCEGTPPTYEIAARYDWDTTELAPVAAPGPGTGGGWDSGVWDAAVWGGDAQPSKSSHGAAGIGESFAIALRGVARTRVTLISLGVAWTEGGPL